MGRSSSTTEFYPGIAISDFAIVQQTLPFAYATPSWGQTVTCNLQRVGDLVVDLCLEIQVHKGDTSYQALPTGSFYPAEALLDKLSINIGGIEIESIDKDWLRVYDSTLRPSDKAHQYCAGANFDATTIMDPASSLETLYLNIPFWFTRATDQALPLVMMNDVPKISVTTTTDPAAVGLDPEQPPQLNMYASYAILSAEASEKFRQDLTYTADIIQSKQFTVRQPNATHLAPFAVDLGLSGWVRSIFWVFKSTSDSAGHARYVGGAGTGTLEQALQADPSSPTGLGPVQTVSEVFAPLAEAAVLIDGNNSYGSRPGRFYNIGQAARFLERLPPPGIYGISLAEAPLYGGGGLRASKVKLQISGKFKKSAPTLVPGALADGVQIEDNCEMLVFAITRVSYTIANGRFSLALS